MSCVSDFAAKGVKPIFGIISLTIPKIFLGGGLGNKSFVGHQLEDFTPEEDLLYTSIAVLQIFDRMGNRKNMARNRMRYLVDEMGWDKGYHSGRQKLFR